tara:strand:+ start:28 stop:243 length:216 start_codon:yes stop_codon:yes gene_type:complete
LFDYLKICINKYHAEFELENSLKSFKKAAYYIKHYQSDRSVSLKRAFSVSMVKSRPTITRLYELMDSLGSI